MIRVLSVVLSLACVIATVELVHPSGWEWLGMLAWLMAASFLQFAIFKAPAK